METTRALPSGDEAVARGAIEASLHVATGSIPERRAPRSSRPSTDQDWAGISLMTQTSTWPEAAYFNQTVATGTLNLWPVPTSATMTVVLYAPEAAAEFSALADTVTLPPGYERMIVKNLAMELAPSYGAKVSEDLQKQALDSLAVVLRSNRKLQELRFPPDAAMSRSTDDIWSDTP